MAKLIDNINFPEDVRKLDDDSLEVLAQELREFIIDKVSKTGGHLSSNPEKAFQFLLDLPNLAAIAVGVKNSGELEMNYRLLTQLPIAPSLRQRVKSTQRHLHIDTWCTGCGSCTTACPSQALRVVGHQCQVDQRKCVFCGYCGAACPEFAIKII